MATGRGGFPDRFYARAEPEDVCMYCGRGHIVLIEWKQKGKKATPLQVERHKELREHGVKVYVVDNLDDANFILGIE